VATLAIALAAPAELAPWGAEVRLVLRAPWPALVALVAALLLLAAGRLPRAVVAPATLDRSALAIGALFVVEPLIHLGLLALAAWRPTAATAEALLPVESAMPTWSLASAVNVAVLVALAPLAEETFFRGRLLPWLDRRVGRVTAVAVTTATFALAHGNPQQVLVALPLGLLLAAVRLSGGSLGACVVTHAVHNGLFVVGGARLIAAPWVPLLLVAAGSGLLIVAWCYHLRPGPRPHRRCLALVAIAVAAIAALAPGYRVARDHLWVMAVHTHCYWWRITNDRLLLRLDALRRRGQLDDGRRAALGARLVARPCQTPVRQTCLLAWIDHTGDAQREPGLIAEFLADLAQQGAPSPGQIDLALDFARRFPSAFANVVYEYPEVLRRWLPLPQAADRALAQIIATPAFQPRRLLLGHLERAYPGQIAALLLRLPADHVTPCDRRHLRGNYPDTDRRLAELARSDPERARAFGYGLDVVAP